MKKLLFLAMVLLPIAGCSTKNEVQKPIEDAKPILLTPAQQKRVGQDNAFSFELMKRTLEKSDEQNVFISPLSVSLCLGMVWNGAVGETKSQMENALQMNALSSDEINDYYKLMQTTLPAIDHATKLNIANSIWYSEGFVVKPDFQKINADYFNATSSGLDFASPNALNVINGWAKEKTNGLIPKVLDEISPDARMILMNAIYFKGSWVQKFDVKNTREADFFNEDGTVNKVNMMNQQHDFSYSEDETAQYLDLPYGNKAFSMTVVLPKTTIKSIHNFTLTRNAYNAAIEAMSVQKVELALPRFEVKNRFQLKPMLKQLGMNLPFEEDADFTQMSDLRPLFIGFVQHDTYVKVDEVGTEAAAVTTTGMYTTSLPIVKTFNVNRPFFFIIREKSTGVILFMGKMGNVSKI